ncbi:restriction endonuclease subunit S [Tenacibaculum dicentrarchi]|uniref:restriction endonuclease subunit S n=1 Tax=Tenacibaculum dicentrarchi TaxID=669041 RepID=UPI00351350B4
MNYSKYTEYKNTGIEWLGEIPKHWNNWKLSKIANFRRGSFPQPYGLDKWYDDENGMPFIQVYDVGNNMRLKSTTKRKISKEGADKSVFIKKGTLILTIQGTIGRIAITQYDAYVDRTLLIFQSYNIDIDINFFKYLIIILFDFEERKAVGSTIKTINKEKLSRFVVPIPPKQQQKFIANFLNYKTEKISRFITKKKQLIKLLNEQKTSVINQAVTKGLNPKIENNKVDNHWIKEIPKSFSLESFSNNVHLKHGFQFRDEHFSKEGVKIVKITQLSPKGYLDLSKASVVPEQIIDKFKNVIIEDGDILMALTGGTIGKIIRADINDEVLLQNYRVGNFYPSNDKLTKEYLYWILKSDFVQAQMKFYVKETGQPNIGKGDFNKILLIIPPIEEQKAIVEYIETEKKTIDKTISTIKKEISLVEEYKTALIAEAVTGKIDVRDFKIPTAETPLAMVAEEAANYNKR